MDIKDKSAVPQSGSPAQAQGNDAAAHGFTDEQIADWRRFEKVRKGGRYNMFDPRARASTGLSAERYSFVMHNFSALKAVAGAK